jgi:membrane fusion protein, copper/silver efflux system
MTNAKKPLLHAVSALLAASLAISCARSGAPVVTRAGDLTLEASLSPDPPREKANTLLLTVKDASGGPVDDAEISARYSMPAMGAMSEMRGKADILALGGGRYRAAFDLPMAGTWTLAVDVVANQAAGAASYRITVGSKGLTAAPGQAGTTAHANASDGSDIAYYTCAMHPSVKQPGPGKCPICSMGLVPVTRQERDSGAIFVDAQRRQAIGVRTGFVERKPLTIHIRAAGKVVYDETRVSSVSVKYRGWIGRLDANTTGQLVKRGQVLFTLYSPELYAAQQEFLAVLESQKAARETAAPDRADYLVAAARTRLHLWDIREGQIDAIASSGKPVEYLPILSTVAGYVIEKNVVQGAAVEPGRELLRIAGLDTIWIEAELYEAELPLVAVGQRVDVTVPYIPGRSWGGRVAFVYPYLENASRTGRVRIEIANEGLELKPDMYANVELAVDRGSRLAVPESAVIYAGPRRLVFLDLGEGRLRPQPIHVGLKVGDDYEVLSGVEAGDRVVTSANFLIAAESRLKSAIEDWR